VNVTINCAGRDQFARRVDLSFSWQPLAYGRNLLALNANVGLISCLSGDNSAVLYNKIKAHTHILRDEKLTTQGMKRRSYTKT
jgi:hypothetical protein